MIYGYARVSADAQTLDAQTEALSAAGAVKVYSEKESGARTNRPALARVLAALDAGVALREERQQDAPSRRSSQRWHRLSRSGWRPP
jgi:DNA invertase Pin-like site-specific DNA recombinase